MRTLVFCTLASLTFALSQARTTVHAQSADLDTAYKREFAFLDAERSTLKKRLQDVDAEIKQKEQQARAELNQLQGRATGLALEADKLQDRLADVEDDSAAQAETADVLQSTVQQAEVALGKGGFKLPAIEGEITPAQRSAQLDAVFEHGIQLLQKQSSVYSEAGEFFASNGKRVEGKIVHVGQVAAFGVGDAEAGALAPAGEERLKVWPEGDTGTTARELAEGKQPGKLKIFLYESLEKEVEKRKEKTVQDLLKAGGPIGYGIVVLGVLALLMAIARAVILARASSNAHKLVAEIAPLVKQRNIAAAVQRAKAANTPAGRVIETTLRSLDRPREQLEDLISEAVLREQPTLDRFGPAILIAAAVGPLLGLLGTVTGMIATFDVITEFGNSNPKLLAGGISEALVTTEFGLFVAIPALLLGNLLGGWAQRIKDDIDASALRLTNIAAGNDVQEMARAEPPAGMMLSPAE